MEEKQISEQESLLLIQQMIDTAKQEQKDDGLGWIIWGWLLFSASALSFLSMKLHWGMNQYFFWNVFGIITILLVIFEACKFFFGKKKGKVRTYTQDLFDKLNIGFSISLMLIIFSMNVGAPDFNVPPEKGFALLLGLYGFWILIYGTVLKLQAFHDRSLYNLGICFCIIILPPLRPNHVVSCSSCYLRLYYSRSHCIQGVQ
jgi:hypothetical protein